MSATYNRVSIAGNLTRDPEMRPVGNDNTVVSFGMATSRKYKDKQGQMQEDTTFVDCEAWGRTAELVGQYLTKGSSALVEGRLKLDRWEDKDGNKRSQLRVVVEGVQFLGGRGGKGEPGGGSGDRADREEPQPLDAEPPF